VQRLAQWRAPRLLPARMPAAVAAAVRAPPFDAMRATPRGVATNLHAVGNAHPVEVGGVVGQLNLPVALDGVDGRGERHFAEAVMMPIRLAVRGDVDQRCIR